MSRTFVAFVILFVAVARAVEFGVEGRVDLPDDSTCRGDYQMTLNIGCHKLHRVQRSWEEARIACEQEGNTLAIVNSQAEAQVLRRLIRDSPLLQNQVYQGAWVGIVKKNGDWRTITGSSLVNAGYDVWWIKGNENCGAIKTCGRFHDKQCNTKLGYICEQHMVFPLA